MSMPPRRFTIGGSDITDLVLSGSTTQAVGGIGEAVLSLDIARLDETQIDWQGEVILDAGEPLTRLFTGVVRDAVPVTVSPTSHIGGAVAAYAVRCVGLAVTLEESVLGATFHSGMPAADVLHLILREADWPRERVEIDGTDDLPLEIFEVAAPLRGLIPDDVVRLGHVRLCRKLDVEAHLAFAGEELTAKAAAADAWAVVCIDASLAADALERGLHAIDVALAYLAARAQDGSTVRAGYPWPYRRSITGAVFGRDDLAFVRGTGSGRVFASIPSTAHAAPVPVAPLDLWTAPPMPERTADAVELALLAWMRARRPDAFDRRVQALSDALEFYAKAAHIPKLFDVEALSRLRSVLKTVDLTADQRARLNMQVGQLNSPSLMMKVRALAKADGVALNDEELAVLKRVRDARNDASHGKQSLPGRVEDLRHALSIVARLLARRAHS